MGSNLLRITLLNGSYWLQLGRCCSYGRCISFRRYQRNLSNTFYISVCCCTMMKEKKSKFGHLKNWMNHFLQRAGIQVRTTTILLLSGLRLTTRQLANGEYVHRSGEWRLLNYSPVWRVIYFNFLHEIQPINMHRT